MRIVTCDRCGKYLKDFYDTYRITFAVPVYAEMALFDPEETSLDLCPQCAKHIHSEAIEYRYRRNKNNDQ